MTPFRRIRERRDEIRAALGLVRPALEGLLSVLFAPRCPACDTLLAAPTRGVVCEICWNRISLITPPICDVCGEPRATWRASCQGQQHCARCRRRRGALDRGRSVGPYEGSLREIIRAFKYEGHASLARPLAELMREHGRELLADADCVVPVPLHRSRLRQRGFNQAAELAQFLGVPVVDALHRLRPTPSQTGLPAGQRHRNVKDAFELTRRFGKQRLDRVVLIDDVVTTGATLEACARRLKAAGVREVLALTVGRATVRRS